MRATTCGLSLIIVLNATTPSIASDDCGSRVQKLDASSAEGQERLDEKNAVIEACARQYKRDKTIAELVKACAKY
jgi:hypothetical protein